MALYHSARGSVGYTIVGSPTIVDGVASGFSKTSFLRLTSAFPTIKKLEAQFCFKLSDISTTVGLFGTSNNTDYQGLGIIFSGTSKKILLYLSSNGSSWDILNGGTLVTAFQTGIVYYLRLIYDGTKYELSSSTDKQNWTTEITVNDSREIFIPSTAFNIGYNAYSSGSTQYMRGEIDLNQTYIIVNGQPWFGIGPIEVKKVSLNNNTVKYIIKDGKLIWADPKLYLVNNGRAYINTGVPSNAVTNYKIDYRITDSSIRIMAFGADISFRNKSDTFIGIANSGLYWYYGTGDSAYHVLLSQSSEYYLQKNRLEVNYSSTSATGSIYNNTEQISSYTTTASELSSNTYYLFGLNRNGTATLDGSLRIYSAQYYGSNINKHLVPVPQGLQIGSFTVPSNGMFDIVNQQFYGNQGAGQFIIGRDE